MTKAIPKPQKRTLLSGVAIPSNANVAPTKYSTLGIPNSCPIRTVPKSASFEPLVTRIPVTEI